MSELILIRHGESTFNAQGKFTGTTDVPLTEKGEQQAREAATKLKGKTFDAVFTSERLRAKDTWQIIQQQLGIVVKTNIDHRLNEQDFGDLEGVNKEEAIRLFGPERVLEWRRAFDGHPPRGERFLAVQTRVAHFFEEKVESLLDQNKTVLLVAHGNSLRALCIYLLRMDIAEIATFELQNAEPLMLNFSAGKPTKYTYL